MTATATSESPRAKKAAPRALRALMWLIFVGFTVFCVVLLLWRHKDVPSAVESEHPLLNAVFTLMAGGLFLGVGIAAYFIMLGTNCLTFSFDRPIYDSVKTKLYLANIAVLTAIGVGLGFAASPVLTPALTLIGLPAGTASFLPVLVFTVAVLNVQVFVLLWAPLEKQLMTRRLQAQGITPEQIRTAILVGISDPQRSSFKKFAGVEEDVGALWISPERLVYWGDSEQFAIAREQLVQVERKADVGGTTLLGGITHVILHLRLAEGSERQVRLHAEACWTMSAKGRVMDDLEERILQWQQSRQPQPSA